ncbi:MAG TPA: tetratricopeptide repeat protein [Planctomycetota bacterium]|nr:tetratricopeptide repeat protein [Planctomycetota bacterium]
MPFLLILGWVAVPQTEDPALDLYYAANALHNRGLHEPAAKEYEGFLRKHPDHPKAGAARLALAASLAALGRDAEAEEAYRTAAGRAADDAAREAAEAGLLDLQARQGRWAQALDTADRLSKSARAPEIADRALYHAAAARLELGRPADAAALLERFLGARPDSPLHAHAQLLLGDARAAGGDREGALKSFRAAASLGAEAAWREAETLVDLGRPDEAVARLKDVDHPHAPRILARAHVAAGRPDEAQRRLEDALLRPGAAAGPLLYELGRLEVARGRFAEAAQRFVDSARTPALAVQARRQAAWCFHRAGQYARSLELCERDAESALLRAENLFLLDRRADARAAYEALPGERLARLRLGQLEHADGRWDSALKQLEPLAKEDDRRPPFDVVDLLIGDSHLQAGRWPDAIAALTRAGARDDALLRLARAHEKNGQPTEARGALERLLKDHPTSASRADAAVELGRLRLAAGDAAGARAVLEPAVASRPAAGYHLGWVALAEKKEDEAAWRFKAALEADGLEAALAADAALQAATLELRKGDGRSAERLLGRALEAGPGFPKRADALHRLGAARAAQERWDEALRAFDEALAASPAPDTKARAIYDAAVCERRAGRPREAARRLDALLAERPAGDLAADAVLVRADLDAEAGESAAAARRLEDFLAGQPSPAAALRARYRLGVLRLSRGEAEPAALAFERLLEEEKEPAALARAAHQAGEARLRRKELDAAVAHFDRAISAGDANPLQDASLLRRAECEALASRWAEAERRYRELLERRPAGAHVADARVGLGWALENQGRFEDALEAYGQAVAAGGRSEAAARATFQRGECLFALKRHDDAVRELIRVEANYAFPAWSARALLEIGRVLKAQGRNEEAAARWEEVVRRYGSSDAAAAARQLLDRAE